MNFTPVLLWSDILLWLLIFAAIVFGVLSGKNPLMRTAWRRIGRNRAGIAAATVLAVFVSIGLLDSLHYRRRLENTPPRHSAVYSVEALSLLDAIAAPLRERNEKTYSAPLAAHAYAKETFETRGADGRYRALRDFPRLRFGGAHLGEDETARRRDILSRTLRAEIFAIALFALLAGIVIHRLRCRYSCEKKAEISFGKAWKSIWAGETEFSWNALLGTLGALLALLLPALALCVDYHIFGTDKVGQDVFYQILKSIRTALVIGLLTTLVTLPLAVLFGIFSGYFRGWIDDVIQYIYTTLSSIPGVLLIAAAVLMMEVVIDTHPQWFATAVERADARLLALCGILGLTSWTNLCRLLRGETLKLRELEYIQAARAFGVGHSKIVFRHILPNLTPVIVIALVMDFSGLVLAEAVLSYIGIGVDPAMTSFGTMINNARMELARAPVVWWSLASSFVFMFALVLAANLFADAVRDAFNPEGE
ncbi:MAG: ABC transporter permease [Candidatus Accumulibacter sp.]|jgi:peptide/nickel transport system permease protein|nr:ABC transporter permease [Accumulibacter sp.]